MVTLEKAGSRFEKIVKLGKMGHALKKGSHLEK